MTPDSAQQPGMLSRVYFFLRAKKRRQIVPLLAQAYRQLVRSTSRVMLTIVGDGPYLDKMKSVTADLPCIFTGRLEGDDLAAAYASSDIFVFPSATDTFDKASICS